MLKVSYESLADIPKGLEEYFNEKNGKYVLQAEGLKTDEDMTALKVVVDKERELRRDADKKLKKFNELPEDFDVNEYHDLKSGKGKSDESAKSIRDTIYKSVEKEMAANKERLSMIEQSLCNSEISKAILQNNIKEGFTNGVRSILRDKVKVENGVVLMDERPIADAFKDFVLSDEGKHYVTAPLNTGGGAPNNSSSASVKTINKTDFNNLTPKEMAKVMQDGTTII